MIDKDFLISQLRNLDARLGPEQHAEIVVRRDDAFDWGSLQRCASCPIPGHQHGQDKDIRYATDGAEGLHGRFFTEHVAFHLDRENACTNPIGHIIQDTSALPVAVIGGLLGAAVDGLRGAAIGAVAGGAIGAQFPARTMKTYELRMLVEEHRRLRHTT